MAEITGRKGGSEKPRAPIESPDSLQSIAKAKILLALGEGEFGGELTGENIYLDGTPILNADGSSNFTGVKWEFRPGDQAQDYIAGMPSVENEISIGLELKSGKAWVRAITNTQLSAIRLRFGWAQLQSQNEEGDVNGYQIKYAIDIATDGGAYEEILRTSVSGKTTSLYERSHRIDLPKATTGWQVRVRRLTENSNSNRIADRMNIQAITDVIDAKLRYPNTALLYVEFDAQQFQHIPQVACEPKGRVIRVPVNYNPELRTYSGTWNGMFKWAWTNNPVWVFYDIQLAERFGLGHRLTIGQVDKWELYRIAQYCDQLVPDGRGGTGMEPRFTCDVYIQAQNEAFNVLRDLAAIFRGMTYWANNQMYSLADMPRDVDYIYGRANVVEGKFTYSSASEKTRYSTALVSWSDPDNGYQDSIEAVSDNALVRRYGVNQLDMTAIGCIRQTEANRRGRWALLTNSKDRSVSFSVGLDGSIPLPGYIIGIADESLSGRVVSGRISAVNGRNIIVDRGNDAKVGDRLVLNLPSGRAEGRTIVAINERVVTVSLNYSEVPESESIWSIDADDLAIQRYRVIGVGDNGDNTYLISGVQNDPDKYERIDTGSRIDERPISIIPPGIQAPPGNIKIDSYTVVSQGIANTTLSVIWDSVNNAIAYEVEWRKNEGNWITTPRTSTLGFEVPNIYAGRYFVRVRAINASEISSVWGNSEEVTLNGKEGAPPALLGFRADGIVFAISLSWGFPVGATDALKTEVWVSKSKIGDDEALLTDIPYPQGNYTMQGLSLGQTFFFKARIVDKSGNTGPWTKWISGKSSDDAKNILDAIKNDVITTDTAKDLLDQVNGATSGLDSVAEAIINNSLATDAGIKRWREEQGKNRAEIIEIRQVQADDRKATAIKIDGVTAKVDENSAAVQQTMSAIADVEGNLQAMYNIKVGVTEDGKYYGAGMGIGVENTPVGMQSQVLFTADRFAVLNETNGNVTVPFAIQNGQTIINNAFIGDGTITNAKIGNVIQSIDYEKGKTGWNIDKKGDVEFNDATFRGDIYSENGYFKGTVYADRIEGDVTNAYVTKPVSVDANNGAYNEKSEIFYYSGMQGSSISVVSLGYNWGVKSYSGSGYHQADGGVKISIDGVVAYDQQHRIVAGDYESSYWGAPINFIYVIPANKDSVEIKMTVWMRSSRYTTSNTAISAGTLLFFKQNSSRFHT